MRGLLLMLACAAAPGLAQATDCALLTASQVQPLRENVLPPVSAELTAPSDQLGMQSGVLAHAYDESQSVDQVLLRLKIEGCSNVAAATPAPSVVDPMDPSVYKPRTEFDNAPWRFDMNQNGKRMTADEFDAWMKSRGVRVARGASVGPTPAAADAPATAPVKQDGDATPR